MGDIKHALNQALAEEFAARKLTRKHIADLLEVDKSFVTKKFTGEGNMTLETLADLAFALDRSVKITLSPRKIAAQSNIAHYDDLKTFTSSPEERKGGAAASKKITFATAI